VYSRIVGYYRSVRNWNKGKREEYGERKLFTVSGSAIPADQSVVVGDIRDISDNAGTQPVLFGNYAETVSVSAAKTVTAGVTPDSAEGRLLLFVRPACPACPGAKAAASKLGIPVDLVNADTEDGMAEAVKRQVFSTPTAILLTHDGQELGRALDAGSISKLIAV
jgi:ribonucleoside-triphosphate reductase